MMKRTGFLISLFLFASSVLALPKEIKLGTQDWPPYQYMRNDKLVGVAVDAVKCVTDKLGVKASIKMEPWLRAQRDTANGIFDGFFAASHSSKRDKFAIQSKPFIKQEWRLYFLKNSGVPKSLKEIKKKHKVFARLNSNVYNWLETNDFNVGGSFTDASKMIDLLRKGRVSVFMENSVVFNHQLKLKGIDPNTFDSVFNRYHNLGVYFGKKFIKKYPDFLKRFNEIAVSECSLL